MKTSPLGTVLQVRVSHQTAKDLKALAALHESSRNGLIIELFEKFVSEWAKPEIDVVRSRRDYRELLAADIRVSAYREPTLRDLFNSIKRVS